MKTVKSVEPYIPSFFGELTHCRAIDDHIIFFEVDGHITGVRSSDPRLKVGENFFDFLDSDAKRFIHDNRLSFDYRALAVDTKLGGALIFTELFGLSGLLLAVIPLSSSEAFQEFFGRGELKRVLHMGLAKSDTNISENEFELVKSVYEKSMEAFSCSDMVLVWYRLGKGLGEHLAGRLLGIADFIGCIGSASAEFDALPIAEDFSPELFITLSSLTVLFARESSPYRRFEAKIGESEGRLFVSFRIDADKNFILYENGILKSSLLSYCDKISAARGACFDCSFRAATGSLIISFIPVSDPILSRQIKQDVSRFIEEFWRENVKMF